MDPIGLYIATAHKMLGHDKTAAIIGMPAGDKAACVLCRYENKPSAERKQAVTGAIGTRVPEETG